MLAVLLLLLAVAHKPAHADRWRPLPNGGGCFVDDRTGNLYGCTQPPPPPPPPQPRPSDALKEQLNQTKAELQAAEEEKERLSATVDAYEQAAAAEADMIAAEETRMTRIERAQRAAAVEANLSRQRVVGRQEAAMLRQQDKKLQSCAEQLAEMGYKHVRENICRFGGAFVDCPPCPGR